MSGFILNLLIHLAAPQTWVLFLFGAIVGSFLNVCIWRIPEGTFFENARSVCRKCGAKIPFYLNIPILSWLLLRGKARCCGTRISFQYPVVEALTGLLFVIIYWKFPFLQPRNGFYVFDYSAILRFAHAATFASLLLVCAAIDFRHMIIPDVISLPMIIASPLVVWLHPDLDWLSALLGVTAGGASLYAIAWLYWLIRKEVGMGMGDVKLLAAIGGWIGHQGIIPTIFYGSILGALAGLTAIVLGKSMHKEGGVGLKAAIPFGPFLALGAIIHLIYGQQLQELLFKP